MNVPFPIDSSQSNLYSLADMANNLSNKATRKHIAKIFERCECSVSDEGLGAVGNWRAAIAVKSSGGNEEDMRKAVIPSLQYNLIEMALEAEKSSTRFQAAKFVLEQTGEGAAQRVEPHVNYEKLPKDQLQVVLKSKLAQLQKLIPGLSLENPVIKENNPMPPETETKAVENVKVAEPTIDVNLLIKHLASKPV